MIETLNYKREARPVFISQKEIMSMMMSFGATFLPKLNISRKDDYWPTNFIQMADLFLINKLIN